MKVVILDCIQGVHKLQILDIEDQRKRISQGVQGIIMVDISYCRKRRLDITEVTVL